MWLGDFRHFWGDFSESNDSQTHSAPRLLSLRSNKRGRAILAGAPLEKKCETSRLAFQKIYFY